MEVKVEFGSALGEGRAMGGSLRENGSLPVGKNLNLNDLSNPNNLTK